MEVYVQVIFILAIAKFCLKAAFTGRLWVIFSYAAVAGIFSLSLYPFVIEQPLTIITDLLKNKKVITDMAVFTTLEAVAGIFVSIFLLDNYFMKKEKRKKHMAVIKVIPGVIVVFALAYFELQFFKFRAGSDFFITALLYSVIAFAVIAGFSLLLRSALTNESAKLELKILLNIAILIIGLLINSSVADYNLSNASMVIDWKALVAIIGLFIVLAISGFFLSKINFKKILTSNFKNK